MYVFEKPAQGWATTAKPAAFLTPAGSGTNAFGYALAVSGDTIAVAAPFTHDPNGQYGVVDLFVKPSTGWKNMHETAKISAPLNTGELAPSLAMNNEHLVVGTSTNKLYVYSKPAAGWKSGPWPSQVFIGQTNQGDGPGYNFGFTVALDGDTIVAGAQAARIDGGVEAAGAVYVFPLSPSAIQISTDTLDFPDMSFGNSAVLPLTITNPSANTLNFTTSLSAPNFQVLKTAENTCIGGVPPGQSCVLPVQFNPPAVGLHTNYLTLSSPSTASFRIIQLRGLAEGLGANSETPLSALANVGTPVTLPLVLKNFGLPGSPTVSVSFSNPVYSLASGGTCTTTGVPEGQTCTLTIEFSPTTGGEFKGNVILTPSSGATSLVPIACAAEY